MSFPSLAKLGFERKARLFCDATIIIDTIKAVKIGKLGFERKARLFCDCIPHSTSCIPFCLCWDLSVRLGYFVTERYRTFNSLQTIVVGI